jgi:hypothetical protein
MGPTHPANEGDGWGIYYTAVLCNSRCHYTPSHARNYQYIFSACFFPIHNQVLTAPSSQYM